MTVRVWDGRKSAMEVAESQNAEPLPFAKEREAYEEWIADEGERDD